MKGGEIFVPKIPSMKIADLAEAVAPDAKKKIIGIRPGEKLHEVLLTSEESRHTKEFDDYFIIEPEFSFWNNSNHMEGKSASEFFDYSSDNNKQWIDKNQIEELK